MSETDHEHGNCDLCDRLERELARANEAVSNHLPAMAAAVKRTQDADRELAEARAAFQRVFALGQCTTEQTGARLTDCQNVALEWLQANAEAQTRREAT